MQTTLLGFAIALILALLAALLGPHFVNWNDHRAFFEAEASRLIGLKVRVGGDIDAAILPVPSVTLRDIAIGPAGEASRLRADTLRIDLGLGPLMRGEFRAAEMRLVAPQLSIGLDRQGGIDWPPLALATETLSIDRLDIVDGRATLTEAASGARLVLDRLRFAGEVRSLTGPLRGNGEFTAGGRRYGYDVSAGRQGADGTRIRLGLKDDERPLAVAADGMLAFERGAPRFDGVLTLSRPAGAVHASGKTKAYEPWRLSSRIKADAAAAALDEVSFQYGPDERAVTLAGSAAFRFGARPLLQGKFAARQADFDLLLATSGAPRRLPLAAVQAFGEMIGSALRPSWPVALSIGVDAAKLGGATLHGIAGELQSDGTTWTLDKLELRAPGFSQVKLSGRLYAVGKGLGFAGGAKIDSNDPSNLLAWVTGNAAATAQIAPWHASGDITLASDRIAVQGLKTEFQRGAVDGSLSYDWPAGNRPARLKADLRAAELDLDALFDTGRTALTGLGLELPRELTLALEIGRARVAGVQARNTTVRLALGAEGLAIERLSIADLGDASIEASGRIRNLAAPGGRVTVDLEARDLTGMVALSEKFVPPLAEPLRRLAGGQRNATLRTTVGLDSSGTDAANGTLSLSGKVGAVRVNVLARASGKRDAFTLANLPALAGTSLHLDGLLETDQAGRLLALVGLDRVPATGPGPARLSLSAHGPSSGDLQFEGKLGAGPIDAAGKGVLRRPSDGPATLDLAQVAGTIGGSKVKGKLALRFGDTPRVDGSIDAEALDAPATIAAAIGMPVQRGANAAPAGWSSEPFAWSASGLAGRIALKAQRAVFLPEIVAQHLSGVARFGRSELVFENIAGELAKGRLEARLAFERGAGGLSARFNAGLSGAEAGEIFAASGGPAISGRLALQTELEGAGRSPAAFMGSLAGYGSVTLEQAELAGLNPSVFGAVNRAVELGVPTEGSRIREFVTGVLANAGLPVSRATAAISVNAGRARFSDVVIKSTPADLQATASVDLADGTLDALLTLTDLHTASGAPPPSVLVALKGPLLAPERAVDTGLLTSWLTLRAVERQSKQLDAMERAGREAGVPKSAKPAEPARGGPPAAPSPIRHLTAPVPLAASPDTTSALPPAEQAPALPPPIEIAPGSKPQAITQPLDLVGAQR